VCAGREFIWRFGVGEFDQQQPTLFRAGEIEGLGRSVLVIAARLERAFNLVLRHSEAHSLPQLQPVVLKTVIGLRRRRERSNRQAEQKRAQNFSHLCRTSPPVV
jgi:hypothetical protein